MQGSKQALLNTRFQIQLALIRKYDKQFNRYRMGAVNYIVYNFSRSKHTLAWKDLFVWDDQREFLRKEYGKEEDCSLMMSRVAIFGEHESNRRAAIRFEYPMMIITNTKGIFFNRLRMLQKMKPIDLSEDYQLTEQQEQEQQKKGTFYLLEQLQKNTIKNESSSQLSGLGVGRFYLGLSVSHESSQYDIYENELTEPKNNTSRYLQNDFSTESQEVEEKGIDHLICDFEDIDQEEFLRMGQVQKRREIQKKGQRNRERKSFDWQGRSNKIQDIRNRYVKRYVGRGSNQEERTCRKGGAILKKAQQLYYRYQTSHPFVQLATQ